MTEVRLTVLEAFRLSWRRCRELLLADIRHHDSVLKGHRQLAEMPLRIGDGLADQRPGAGFRHPAARVQLRAADERVAMEQVDEAVIGELRHQGLGHLAQGDIQLQGARQPLADPLEQADPVTGPLAAAPGRLPGHDNDAGDLTIRRAQWGSMRPDEHPRSVDPLAGEGPLPGPAPQHVLRHVLHGRRVRLLDPERLQRPPARCADSSGKPKSVTAKALA